MTSKSILFSSQNSPRGLLYTVLVKPRAQALLGLERLGKKPDRYTEIGRERARVLCGFFLISLN
jgi:hypothetical protein